MTHSLIDPISQPLRDRLTLALLLLAAHPDTAEEAVKLAQTAEKILLESDTTLTHKAAHFLEEALERAEKAVL